MVTLALPHTMDSPTKLCFCGRETMESHEFLFCSSACARQDSLRSLNNSKCHYRNIVEDAYVRAGAPELLPRRMPPNIHIRPGPAEHRGFVIAQPPLLPPSSVPQYGMTPVHRSPRNGNMAASPSRVRLPPRPIEHTMGHIPREIAPWPEPDEFYSSRHAPLTTDGHKHSPRKSPVAALLDFGRSHKGKEAENPERVFRHTVNTTASPEKRELRRDRFL